MLQFDSTATPLRNQEGEELSEDGTGEDQAPLLDDDEGGDKGESEEGGTVEEA